PRDNSRIWTQSERSNEPFVATLGGDATLTSGSLFRIENNAYELVSMVYKGNDLYIRLFNAKIDASHKTINFQLQDVNSSLVELANSMVDDLTVTEKKGASSMRLSIPRYGIRTLKLSCKNI
ncbi:MAG: glycoside hydrolase, partial [Parabacteroides sp.]|nr:glycoside hydrolase [Parabacteroides sp.]